MGNKTHFLPLATSLNVQDATYAHLGTQAPRAVSRLWTNGGLSKRVPLQSTETSTSFEHIQKNNIINKYPQLGVFFWYFTLNTTIVPPSMARFKSSHKNGRSATMDIAIANLW